MEAQNKTCQNCKKDFTIEPEDFNFYEKIKVPPPTFCRECRLQRRLAYRNTHALYRRKDSFWGKDFISSYSSDKNLIVIDQKTWWGDSWDPFSYSIEYNFSKPFFEQWAEFRNKFPLQGLTNSQGINSDYCNFADESKDCYLISASWKNERVFYSNSITDIKDSMDLYVVHRTQFSYDDVNCTDSYQLFYSQDSHNCVNSYFLYDCRGCTDCFMCSNMRSKSYCFFNRQLTKEEYQKRMKEINLSSYSSIQQKKKDFEEMKLKSIHRFAHILNSYNVSGNNIENGKNAHYCFDSTGGVEDSKDVFWTARGIKDCISCGPAVGMLELGYESFDTGVGGKNCLFCSNVYTTENVEYSFNCFNSSNLFACLGLRNKHYCIFNKQYKKEDFFVLREKIIKHMNDMPYIDKKGNIYKYGEFFPTELSPFCYNETIAQDYFLKEKEEILASGLSWKDSETRNYKPTILPKDIPDDIKDVSDDIVNEIIGCEHKGECKDRCTTAFKIIRDELTFYKRFDIPLPRLCSNCRYYTRFKQRNPLKLWHRKCMKENCTNEFETSYSPDRPEIVYCEKCYNGEVY
ncbi:MAG: hypothetical protein NDI62_00380 [Burkholderiales bacterium]|nr:hypothetical protein [Burkholderiales bacterium]